jgi:nodulation protein E
MTERKRVFVTGMGAVSAAGVGAKALWHAARDGRSGVREATFRRPYRGRIRHAAQVSDFDASAFLEPELLPFCDEVTQFLLVATDEAMAAAGLLHAKPLGPRTASIIGTGIGGGHTIEDNLYTVFVKEGRPDALAIPRLIASTCPATISMRYGTTGPCFAVVSACSSATQAIGIGAHMVRSGAVDRAIVGGTEDCVVDGGMLAWEGLRVLTPNFCRPFSKDRNGMVLGSGAAVFVLEADSVAAARNAPVLAEIAGYGTTSDAKDHVRPDVDGAAGAMQAALVDAGVTAEEIDYVNAHGTGTTINDMTESAALGIIFGTRLPHVPVSSTKPVHGHGLGAAGALELVVTIGAMREGVIPPTINWNKPDEKCPVDPVANEARPASIRVAMSNSFAFGGINATLVLRRAEAA